MSDETTKKPDLKLVPEEELDEEELEFRSIRKDLPGVKGASAVGVVTIAVGKTPGKNEFFRTNKEFRPVVPMVDVEVGMEKHYFCVADNMIEPLASIGMGRQLHRLFSDGIRHRRRPFAQSLQRAQSDVGVLRER
jgi:hypothetical protein